MVNVRWTPEQEEEFIRAVEEIGVSRYGPWVVDIHSGRACPCRSLCVFACLNLKSTMATARDMHRASAGAIRLRGACCLTLLLLLCLRLASWITMEEQFPALNKTHLQLSNKWKNVMRNHDNVNSRSDFSTRALAALDRFNGATRTSKRLRPPLQSASTDPVDVAEWEMAWATAPHDEDLWVAWTPRQDNALIEGVRVHGASSDSYVYVFRSGQTGVYLFACVSPEHIGC